MNNLQRNAPLVEETLVDLLRRAQRGEPSAFDGLYLLYADRIFRYLLARVGTSDLAEEVTAQVFLRLVEKVSLYRLSPQDNVAIFSAWLYRLTYNRLVDHMRQVQRTSATSLDQVQSVADHRPILDQVESQIDFERIADKLLQLNDSQRQVLILRFIEGFSLAETAEIMQKNEGAIKALQHRALENLRRLLS